MSTLPTVYGENVVLRLVLSDAEAIRLDQLGMPAEIRERFERLLEHPHGMIFVVKVAPEFEVVEVNALDGLFWSTPSVAGKSLLVRSAERLTCIRE